MLLNFEDAVGSEVVAEDDLFVLWVDIGGLVEIESLIDEGNRISAVLADSGVSCSEYWGEFLEKSFSGIGIGESDSVIAAEDLKPDFEGFGIGSFYAKHAGVSHDPFVGHGSDGWCIV